MAEPTRKEIEPFCWLLERCFWQGEGCRAGKIFRTWSTVYVPDLYESR